MARLPLVRFLAPIVVLMLAHLGVGVYATSRQPPLLRRPSPPPSPSPSPSPSPLHLQSKGNWLINAAFFFAWVGQMYYIALISFDLTDDWEKVFFDCFTPVSFWMDSAYSGGLILMHMTLIKDYKNRLDLIVGENVGMIANFIGMYHYLAMKNMHGKMPRKEAKKHLIPAVGFYLAHSLLFMLELQYEWYLPDQYDTLSKGLAVVLLAICSGCELMQVVCGLYFRCKRGKWDNDERAVYWTKFAAAASIIISSGFDAWNFIKVQKFLKMGLITFCAACIPLVSTSFAIMLTIFRTMGPQRLRDWSVIVWESICWFFKGLASCFCICLDGFGGAIKSTVESLWSVLKSMTSYVAKGTVWTFGAVKSLIQAAWGA